MVPRRLRPILDYLRFLMARFGADRCTQVAASLTYTTLLSIVPLVTIALTMVAAFPVFESLSTELKVFLLTHMVPDQAGKIITVHMTQFADNAAKLTAVGIAFLAVTAMMLMHTIDNAMNGIWRVRARRTLVQRVLIYWALLTVGPLLVGASLSLTSWLVSASMGLTKQMIPGAGLVLLKVVPVLLTGAAFTLMFMTVPNRQVPWVHALIGGLVAAVLFEAMKRGFGLYVSRFPTYKLVYGAFAAFPIFLLWIYLSWLSILVGAVVSASMSSWRAGDWRRARAPGHEFDDALGILAMLYRASRRGGPVRFADLRRELPISFEELERILDRMAEAGWVSRTAQGTWTLVRDPECIAVAEVWRLFVFDPPLSGRVGDEAVRAMLARVSERSDADLSLSVKALFEQAAEAPEVPAQTPA